MGAPRPHPLEPRLAIRRALVRRHLHAAVAGKSDNLKIDLHDGEVNSAALLVDLIAPLDPESISFRHIASAIKRSGSADTVIDGLGSRDPIVAARSARIAGAMRMEQVVPWLTPLLWSRWPRVRDSATRALSKIGGVRSADALLMAIQRIGPRPSLIVALARAAPDLYLEAVLGGSQLRAAHPAVATAAGLRGRRTAIAALILQLRTGSRRARKASSRALGWLGAPAGIAELTIALEQRDWWVRMSAAKALGAIPAYQPGPSLRACLADRNPRVRRSAQDAIRRLGRR
ncbi:MAG TPA: HEAT repeat domain-containing protein [Methylomirabilota bacterium]|nr:HEAT repeat domain-containing protein [Methylomirabilota bacterium]